MSNLEDGLRAYREAHKHTPTKDEQILELLSRGAWVPVAEIAALLDSNITDPKNLASIRLSQLNKKLKKAGIKLEIERKSFYRLTAKKDKKK